MMLQANRDDADRHQRPPQPDPEEAAVTTHRKPIRHAPRPDTDRGEKVAQADEQANRGGGIAQVADHDAVPDAGGDDIGHTRTQVW